MFHKTGGNMLGAASAPNGGLGAGSTKPEYTLSDYIERKEKAYKPKLMFEEWVHHRFPAGVEDSCFTTEQLMEQSWKAAQENV